MGSYNGCIAPVVFFRGNRFSFDLRGPESRAIFLMSEFPLERPTVLICCEQQLIRIPEKVQVESPEQVDKWTGSSIGCLWLVGLDWLDWLVTLNRTIFGALPRLGSLVAAHS